MTDQEINEAVARKLGWIINKTLDYKPWYGRPNSQPESAMVRELPDFCHAIEAAWEIVESFEHRKAICLNQHLQPPYGFTCTIWSPMTEEADCHERADTAPMAICLAFLKVEEEK